MPGDGIGRDYIDECARHQNVESSRVSVYAGLSDEGRSALVTMTSDADRCYASRWAHPPDEL